MMKIFAKINNLTIYCGSSLSEICSKASKQVIANIKVNYERCNIGVTPSKPLLPLFKYLIEDHRENKTKYKHVYFYCLNDYVALKSETCNLSNKEILKKQLTKPLKIKSKRIFFPTDEVSDYDFSRFDRKIWAAGELNLSIMDLGNDGQLAFNESNSLLSDLTRVVELSQNLRMQKSKRFGDKIAKTPILGVTASLPIILNSKQIIIIATGTNKANAIKQILKNKVNPIYPCTHLINHHNASIYIDDELAKAITKD